MTAPMKPIPISAAERIAKSYGQDQVVIIARRVGEEPEPCGEHVTTLWPEQGTLRCRSPHR